MTSGDDTIYGRERELARFDEVVAEVAHGGRHTLVVCGSAGIGKTTLVDALVRRAARSGPGPRHRGRVCMANAGLRFASELLRRLAEVLGEQGPSEAQVSRLVRSPPERLNLRTLAALCEVLDCEPADLLHRSARPHHPVTDHRQGAQ